MRSERREFEWQKVMPNMTGALTTMMREGRERGERGESEGTGRGDWRQQKLREAVLRDTFQGHVLHNSGTKVYTQRKRLSTLLLVFLLSNSERNVIALIVFLLNFEF